MAAGTIETSLRKIFMNPALGRFVERLVTLRECGAGRRLTTTMRHSDRSCPENSTNVGPLTPVEILERGEDHGAIWRVMALGPEHVSIDLCACTGEPVDRLD